MSQAWLLDVGLDCELALGGRELLQLIDAPSLLTVPLAPAYCRQVVVWQERLLPVLDLSLRRRIASEVTPVAHAAPSVLAVVAYTALGSQQIEVGALCLQAPPRKVEVSNLDAISTAEQVEKIAAWGDLAISGFMHQGRAIAILNLGKVFAPGYLTQSALPTSLSLTSSSSAMAA